MQPVALPSYPGCYYDFSRSVNKPDDRQRRLVI
jgi:hypothetical protein